ncbi:MAG TPA: aminoglycoside phosphotransferase [Jatrophihabitans sp.]|nr:aminoglycoside phosphotransferase [Jatrophihabitans sp.]
MRVEASEITRVLIDWLPQQRWFGGKSRQHTVEARVLATLADKPHPVQLWVADVHYTDATGQHPTEHYQVPLVLRADAAEQLTHAFVGSVADTDGGSPIAVYDALHDKEATGHWLEGIADQVTTDGVSFVRTAGPDEIPVGELSLALTAEQSNTSLVFGDTAILKVFRRLEAGLNPDIEIHDALGRLGGRHLARLLGYVTAEIDGRLWSLAMLQEFMTTATDGWQLATNSVRDLMAEADLHAEEAGGDFAGEAHRLGVATAEVHADLATAFGTSELGRDDLADRARAMNGRLDAALREVPELAEVEAGLRQAYADFAGLATAGLASPVTAQRIHGDLHLGQVLRTSHRWVVLDFEGEPAKSIADRQAADSPIRDVAGMLRSFDYAARHQLIDIGSTPQSEFRANEWAERNRSAFCDGYAEGGGLDPAAAAVLLRAYEADKAVYESVYEARNRPHWLPIPLASLHRLARLA